jgi:hypothetical protein
MDDDDRVDYDEAHSDGVADATDATDVDVADVDRHRDLKKQQHDQAAPRRHRDLSAASSTSIASVRTDDNESDRRGRKERASPRTSSTQQQQRSASPAAKTNKTAPDHDQRPATSPVTDRLVVDRTRTCPFLLRVFVREGGHNHLDEYQPPRRMPAHEFQIYSWYAFLSTFGFYY